jgi:hypothetical protein
MTDPINEHSPFPKDQESTFEVLAKEIADRIRGEVVFLMICGGAVLLIPVMLLFVGLFGPKRPDEVPPGCLRFWPAGDVG